jgi:uncharacterized protein YlzI (FlbEa/FlbD family)
MAKMMKRSEQLRNALLLLALTSPCVFAQDKVVNYSDKPLYVEGEGVRPPPTDEELQYIDSELNKQGDQLILNSEKADKYRRLQKTTEKLANTTERYVKEKKSSEKKINEYNKKIQCLLEEDSTDPECDAFLSENEEKDVIQVQQAAPAQQVIVAAAPEETTPPARFIERLKISPFLMGTTYSGNGLNNVETKPGFGVKIDADLNKSFTFGLGFSYSNLTIKDVRCNQNNNFNNSFNGNGYNNYNAGLNDYCNNMNYNSFGNNRNVQDINNKKFGVDVTGRFNFAYTDKFIPYVGLGVGWNKMNLEFATDVNNSNGVNYGYNYNDDAPQTFATSYFSGRLSLGADYYFTKMFGMNLEFNYSRGFANLNSDIGTNYDRNTGLDNNRYQRVLEDIGDQLMQANALTLQAGVIIAF